MGTNKTSAAPAENYKENAKIVKTAVFLGKTRGKWGKWLVYLAYLWERRFSA
jgi:hypothetical protein